MASVLGLQLQAPFAFGAKQRWSRVGLWPAPAPASNQPLKKACVLRPSTPRLSRGRVRSSWAASGPPEGPSVERKAITARRKAAAGLQAALAVAAAFAVGASLCLSRKAAAMPDPIGCTATAPEENPVKVRPGITKVLLREIMFEEMEQCENARRQLLGDAFGLLPLDTQWQLLEQTISPVHLLEDKITKANIGPHEKYEMLIAIVQIHMAMHGYREANKVLKSTDALPKDYRIPLLKAVIDMMLALETLLTGATTEDKEVQELIKSAEESWTNYYELKKGGFVTEPNGD